MQPANTVAVISNDVQQGSFIARPIDDTLGWGEGTILPQSSFSSEASQLELLRAVLSSIEPVAKDELPYSACTDGRVPVALLDGHSVPVREQMVGADIVSAFFVAEMLGKSFYQDPSAPVSKRVADVAAFLKENNIEPSSHLACGAGAGYATILSNLLRYADTKLFVNRVQTLAPTAVYDEQLFASLLQAIKEHLDADSYNGLSVEVFINAAQNVSSAHAVAELKNDGRGVSGHVEEQIIRIRVPGYAINEAKVAEITGGREVFGVNDNRMDAIARLFSRGSDEDYRRALLALEAFADAAHGTLAHGLPTYIVDAA
jgi:hypothetical protein